MVKVIIEKDFDERRFTEDIVRQMDIGIHQCYFLMLDDLSVPRLVVEQHFDTIHNAFARYGYNIHRTIDPSYIIIVKATEYGMISANEFCQ